MSPITTHVLDLAAGRPATGVAVTLSVSAAGPGQCSEIARGVTDADGRVGDLLPDDRSPSNPASTRSGSKSAAYFARSGSETSTPTSHVVVPTRTREGPLSRPLLLSPFGYSTYRGS